MKDNQFQINLGGMIDLLSNHLYSNPGIFVRELLQNGVDAIQARKRLGHAFEPMVRVELFPSSHTLAFQDNGCGLTESEIEEFLASIGSSSKRSELDAGDDFIGQFGVGLLSCFIVSDEIVLITRSATDGVPLEWRGRPDGTYSIRTLKREIPVGTAVYLKAKPDFESYFEFYFLEELLGHYGRYVPTPICLIEDDDEVYINEIVPPWKMSRDDAIDYAERQNGHRPLDAIPLHSRIGGVEGVAYVLPYPVSLHEEKSHHVYLKHMLLSDKMDSILPSWAFFVSGVIHTVSLRPTASREALQENDLFHAVREELGDGIKRYMIGLAEREPELFQKIVTVHYRSLKAMAVEDSELYGLFIRYLKFETCFGDLTMNEILERRAPMFVTATLDEFRQVARIAKSQDMMVINGGYVHDLELVRKLPLAFEDAEVHVLDILEFSSRFEPLDAEEALAAQPFLDMSDELLESYRCRSLVRWFEPANIAVLYNTNEDVNFFKLAEESERQAGPLFADVVNVIRTELHEAPYARLCYNYNNPLVRKAIAAGDRKLQQTCIELFYTQALLMGNHPLNNDELRLMNDALMQFMNLGLNGTAVTGP